MSNKSLVKFGAGFVLLAAVLIFLGVNFVPRIYASSSTQRNVVIAGIQTRPDYLDESYPRAILDPRNPQAIPLSVKYYTGSDWIERHPSNYYINSDWIERHPVQPTQQVNYLTGSDWIERHPSNYYSNSDWIERHPAQPSR
jgi:hypothetical protein